ncbi:unnamed protein product [Sphacelaria rigidula]
MSDPLSVPYPSMLHQSKSFTSASCGKIVHKNANYVALGQEVSNASYVHDTSTNTSTEIVRDQVAMDPTGDSASMSLGVLHESASGGVKTIQPIMTTTSDATTVTSLNADSVFNLTLDGSISWDSDDACLYLSSNKAFRFHYVESDGITASRLVLEGLDESSGAYMPKVEFSTD